MTDEMQEGLQYTRYSRDEVALGNWGGLVGGAQLANRRRQALDKLTSKTEQIRAGATIQTGVGAEE